MNGGTGLESGAVRAPEPADAAAIAAIHEEGLASGHAS